MSGAQRNLVILGPQGSGKGTQAALLAERYHLAHVETGKIFRSLSRRHSPLGRRVHYLINTKGALIPDSLVIRLLRRELEQVPRRQGVIFDGFPRTVLQARALDRLLRRLKRPLTAAIYMPITRATSVRRLALRRICSLCGRVYILGKNLPRNRTTCTSCRGKIIQRDDDRPLAISRRLHQYRQHTAPVINYYRQRGILTTVDGEPSIPRVHREVLSLLRWTASR